MIACLGHVPDDDVCVETASGQEATAGIPGVAVDTRRVEGPLFRRRNRVVRIDVVRNDLRALLHQGTIGLPFSRSQ